MTRILNPKQLLKQYRIKPLKWLGQNFLINENVLRKIIDTADLTPKDTVLEIGPGLGILTIELAKRVKKLIAIEKDRALCKALEDILKTKKINNVKVINKDVLQISNFKFLIFNQFQNSKFKIINYKVVANLPYYITSPVIRKFLEIENKPELMVLMVQKEVAQRIMAKPPHMNLLAISVQFYSEPKIISYINKKSFYPQPKVDSAIIKITPKEIPKIDTKKFFNLVRAGFSSKRKFLINNLSEKVRSQKSKVKNMLEELNINPKTRAENLSIKDWLNVYETFENLF